MEVKKKISLEFSNEYFTDTVSAKAYIFVSGIFYRVYLSLLTIKNNG